MLGLLALHLGLSPLLLWPRTSDGFEYPKAALLHTAGFVLVALGAGRLIERLRGPEPVAALRAGVARWDLSCFGAVAVLASAALSTFAGSNPGVSWLGAQGSFMGLLTIAAYTALFFATRAAVRDVPGARSLLAGALAASLVVCVYAGAQLARLDPFTWTQDAAAHNRPFSTLGHPNFLSAYLVCVFPLAAWFALDDVGCGRRIRAGLFALFAAAVVALVGAALSRGGWLAGLLTGAALVAGWWAAGERRAAWALVTGAVLLAAVALVLLALDAPGTGGWVEGVRWRFGMLERLRAEPRFHIWGAAWRMFLDHPLLGAGLETFGIEFERYRTPAYWLAEWNASPRRAHNEILQVAATQGSVGLAAWGVLLAGVARNAWRVLRASSLRARALAAALAAVVAGFVAGNLFSLTLIPLGALAATCAAVLSRLGRVDESQQVVPAVERPGPRHGIVAHVAAWALVALAWVALVAVPFAANDTATRGWRLAQTGHPLEGAALLERAVALDPRHEFIWVELGGAYYLAAQTAARARTDVRRALLERSLAAHERSIELVPRRSYDHANTARTLLALALLSPPAATPERVYAALDRALGLDPANAYVLRDACGAAYTLGDLERTSGYASRLNALFPDYGPGRFYLGLVALRQGDLDRALVDLEAAEREHWYADAERKAGSVLPPMAAAHLLRSEPERALQLADLALAADPRDVAAWLGRGQAQEMRAAKARAAALAAGTDDERHERASAAARLFADAVVSYLRALAIEPENTAVRAALERLRKPAPSP